MFLKRKQTFVYIYLIEKKKYIYRERERMRIHAYEYTQLYFLPLPYDRAHGSHNHRCSTQYLGIHPCADLSWRPEEWTEHIDAETKNVYYYHSKSGEASWTKPCLLEVGAAAKADEPWPSPRGQGRGLKGRIGSSSGSRTAAGPAGGALDRPGAPPARLAGAPLLTLLPLLWYFINSYKMDLHV